MTGPRATTAGRARSPARSCHRPSSSTAGRRTRRRARRRTPRLVERDDLVRTAGSTSSTTPRSSTASCTRGRRAVSSGCPTSSRTRSPTASIGSRALAFWRWPTVRLNQINWYALVYAADATVTGRPAALATPFQRQLARFVDAGRRGLRRRMGNFGPGLRFHAICRTARSTPP